MKKLAKWAAGALALLCAFGLGRGDTGYTENDLSLAREEAYNSGYEAGLDQGAASSQQEIYEEGFSQGQLAGFDLGVNEGLNKAAARQDEVLLAVGDTYQQGYDLGYAEGYAQKTKDQLAQREQYVASLQASLEDARAQLTTAAIAEPPVEQVPDPQPETGQTVYVTKSGSKYHLSGCSHLSKSKIEKPLSEAKAAGYTPCKTCKPPQ